MLNAEVLAQLQGRKNLLAFSAGGDSTALFFVLRDADIDFDIALVNYHTRLQSDAEADYAEQLGTEYGKQCYIHHAAVSASNFEHEARHARYAFFESLIAQHGYDNLITAHQLDDRLEWMMMQLCKGAGVTELVGMTSIEPKKGYVLVRPLLQTTKQELVDFLKHGGHRWFEDESNADESYRRNFFRRNITQPMLERYPDGIKKSFVYLDEDLKEYDGSVEAGCIDELWWFQTPVRRSDTVRSVDKALKRAGFLMRQGDRERLKQEDTVVVGRRFVVSINPRYTFIAPYLKRSLEKPFKEECRALKIDPKLRPYLAASEAAFEKIASLLGSGNTVDLHRK